MSKTVVYPKWTDTEVPTDATCQETFGIIGDAYLRCGKPATCIVGTRDTNPYYMCTAHGDHTVRNRGGRYLAGGTDANIR